MAFEPDDLEPRPLRPKPTDLTLLSLEDLADYIAELKAEIVRAEAAIAARRDHIQGAESLFRKPG
jgi:uncharacterized small protein (DUF1192 family)